VKVWFASSHGFRAEIEEYDVRPGGVWRLKTRKSDIVEHPHGVFHEIVPPRRLVYSYRFLGTDFHSTISIDLSPHGQKTRMLFCQTGFPEASSRDDHEGGWGVVWRMFGEVLAAQHGIGSAFPPFSPERKSEVIRDLEAARKRFEEEREHTKSG
jgi:uncharacterized protein YndB with AHSA1/START domain